jgi:YVTN family beta-propeller protein
MPLLGGKRWSEAARPMRWTTVEIRVRLQKLRRTGGALITASLLVGISACGRREEAFAPAPQVPAGWRVYVTNELSNDLSVIDGATNAVIATISVGKRPRGVRASPDGRTLYIALSGSPLGGPNVDEDALPPPDKSADGIGVFDVASGKLVRTIRGVSDPEQLDIARDGRLFIASEDTGTVVVIDPVNDKVLARAPVGGEPEGVKISPDGRFAFVTSEEDHSVTIIDVATLKPLGRVSVGQRPRNTVFTADSKRAYVGGEFDGSITVVDVESRRVLNTVKLADRTMLPMDMVLPGDGKRLFVSGGRGGKVAVLDAGDLSLVATIPVGQRPWGLAVSPDGTRLYAANGPSNDVTVIDIAALKVVATVKAGTRPWGGVAVMAK